MTKILPCDVGAAKAFDPHLPSCGLYQHTPTDWSNPYCTCDPVGRLAAAFAAHRLEHGGEVAEIKREIATMRMVEAERLLGLARSCLAGRLGDEIDSYFAATV